MIQRLSWALAALIVAVTGSLSGGCGSEIKAEPRHLLLAPADFNDAGVTLVSLSEELSLDGPSAQVELEGAHFRIIQSLILYESPELALAALDGIRADLVNQGHTSPGEVEASGMFEHNLGSDEAASLFFIESRGLVRLTVTGADRHERLPNLADAARRKLQNG